METINKNDAVRVGGNNALHTITGLPVFRRHTSFEANREIESAIVFYNEWQETPNGAKVECRNGLKYCVKNISAVTQTIEASEGVEEHEETITPENTKFNKWYFYPIMAKSDGLYIGNNKVAPLDYAVSLGENVIIYNINYTLQNHIPFDAIDGYVIPMTV